MVSSLIAPPLVLPFLGGPSRDRDRQVLDARAVGRPVGERVLEKAGVVALGEIGPGMRSPRLVAVDTAAVFHGLPPLVPDVGDPLASVGSEVPCVETTPFIAHQLRDGIRWNRRPLERVLRGGP